MFQDEINLLLYIIDKKLIVFLLLQTGILSKKTGHYARQFIFGIAFDMNVVVHTSNLKIIQFENLKI